MDIQWSNWASRGRPQETDIARPFVQHNQDGRLEVFALGQGEIFNVWQVFPNAGWSDGWHSKGRPAANVGIKAHVVGRNADGRQQIFALGGDNALWQSGTSRRMAVGANGRPWAHRPETFSLVLALWSRSFPLGEGLPAAIRGAASSDG